MTLDLRYDGYDPDAVLSVSVQRSDDDGEPISPPLLKLEDRYTCEVIHLTREQAWKLRELIDRM